MIKFLKVTAAGGDNIIPLDQILTAKVGGANRIQIITDNVGFKATGASQTLNFTFNFTGDNTTQLNAFVDLVAEAAATSWTNPIFDMTDKLPFPVTSIIRVDTAYA